MKILVVCSGNVENFNFETHQAFIADQVKAVIKQDSSITFDFFFIKGRGIRGYLENYKRLIKSIGDSHCDIIHAHFALSGLLANLQRKVPVITTFHGSDINNSKTRYASELVALLSFKTIYVSKKLLEKSLIKRKAKYNIIPCGVDLEIFKPMDRVDMRTKYRVDEQSFYILFSSSFSNHVKNYPLVEQAIKLITDKKIVVWELKDLSRQEVAERMNCVDACVMSSFSEGSPQFIKEAMACNCPIVSCNVGDVKEVIDGAENCYIANNHKEDFAIKLNKVLTNRQGSNGREKISSYDNRVIAKRIIELYKSVLS